MTANHENSGEQRPTHSWWVDQEEAAQDLMSKREASGANISLIAIAGQHPSIEEVYPNNEYRLRLETAILFARGFASRYQRESQFATLSSRLIDEKTGQAERASLADMGEAYLISRGITADRIHGEWNQFYKGDAGVYNSADESFVVSSAFKDHPEFRDLTMIASPGQLSRFNRNFIANGVLPRLEIPLGIEDLDEQYHKGFAKRMCLLIYTIAHDPTWQGENSMFGKKSRKMRRPADGIESKISIEELVDLYRKKYPVE